MKSYKSLGNQLKSKEIIENHRKLYEIIGSYVEIIEKQRKSYENVDNQRQS